MSNAHLIAQAIINTRKEDRSTLLLDAAEILRLQGHPFTAICVEKAAKACEGL